MLEQSDARKSLSVRLLYSRTPKLGKLSTNFESRKQFSKKNLQKNYYISPARPHSA